MDTMVYCNGCTIQMQSDTTLLVSLNCMGNGLIGLADFRYDWYMSRRPLRQNKQQGYG